MKRSRSIPAVIRMSLLGTVTLAAVVLTTPPGRAQQDMVVKHNLGEVAWQEPPPGVADAVGSAIIVGDLNKPGMFIVLFKFPANHLVPAHFHPAEETVTVLSGGLYVGMGNKADRSKGELLTSGGYVWLPARMAHYGWTNEPTVIQVEMQGPFSICYIDPADDPRGSPAPDAACAGGPGTSNRAARP